MTDVMMGLRSLVETAPDADLLCGMIGFSAECRMALEMGKEAGAAHGNAPPTAGSAHRRPRPWTGGSRSCSAAPASPPSSSPTGRRRRR